MGFVAKGRYRVIRSSEIGKKKLEAIVAILDIPDLNPPDILDMSIDIELKDPHTADKKDKT